MIRHFFRFLVIVSAAAAMLSLGIVGVAPRALGILEHDRTSELGRLVGLTDLSQRSLVYARDGSLLAVLHAEENRSPVALDEVSPAVVNAILDVEDDRFWRHGGVDLRSTVRALVSNVSAGEITQGGSTITQQVVKNALLTPERNLSRKIKEAALAVRLEDQMSKRQILERYLNTVYFGNGAYGVQAAAESYWNTSAKQLTLAQAALLAGLIRNPVNNDPIKYPEVARERRHEAAVRMLEQGDISAAEVEAIDAEPLPTQLFRPLPPPNDYFVEEVKLRLLRDKRLGETAQDRYNAVFKGGLQIHTTLDPRMQEQAKAAVADIVPDTKGRFTAALAAVEPSTGAVRAIVAGDDFTTAKYNLATQGRRQPGSSFKAFVLVAALQAGYSPGSTVDGTSPCAFRLPGARKPYTPSNYEGSGGAVTSIARATHASMNCAYVRMGLAVGLSKVVETAKAMGINSPLEEVASISLGSKEVTPLEMAGAYATLGNDGVHHEPTFIEKVLDRNGETLFGGFGDGRQAVPVHVARVATDVLKGVVSGGTGTRARLSGRQVAGKTGTSQNHENAWFVGYTPQLSTAVWMGAPVGNVPMTNVGGIRVAGGTYPARIWNAFMSKALDGQPAVAFPAADYKQLPRGKGAVSERYSVRAPSSTIVDGEADQPPAGTEPTPPPAAPPPTAPPDTRPAAPSGHDATPVPGQG